MMNKQLLKTDIDLLVQEFELLITVPLTEIFE